MISNAHMISSLYDITVNTYYNLPTPQIVVIIAGSVLLGFLTEYLTGDNADTTQIHAFLYVLGIALCAYSSMVASSSSFHTGWMIALHVKIILTSAIYQKVCHPKYH